MNLFSLIFFVLLGFCSLAHRCISAWHSIYPQHYSISSHPFALEEKDWSFFVFAQQWPPAACLQVPGNKCLIPKDVKEWSIHGLWPTSDKGYPSFCNHSWPFQPGALKPLVPELEVKWPNIYANTSEFDFWKHEWTKHGTCATSLPHFDTELKYFNRSLHLHDRFNIFKFLHKAGIHPSADKPIMLEYVENAIHIQMNATVKLFCKTHKEYSDPILTSMYVCLDKKLGLIDCDKIYEKPCTKPLLYYLPFNGTYL